MQPKPHRDAMFDRIIDSPRTRRPWLAVLLSASVIGHIAVAGGLMVFGLWQLDRLAPPERRARLIDLGNRIPVPRQEKASVKVEPEKKRAARRPTRTTQPGEAEPTEATTDTAIAVVAETDTSAGRGSPDGLPGGLEGGSTCIVGCGDQPNPLLDDLEVKEPPKLEPLPPKAIPSEWLDGTRIAGEDQIHPPETVRIQMLREGQDRLEARVKMCLDVAGRVDSLRLVQSTGYDAYDREFLREMRHWRYQPYRAGGQPVPVCTVVEFIYRMRR